MGCCCLNKNGIYKRSCSNINHYNHIGTLIGENNGVKAFLNCDNCILKIIFSCDFRNYVKKEELNSKKNYYTGYKHQCVEYVRRWLLFNKRVLFGDIGIAHDIFQKVNAVENIDTAEKLKLASIENGGTSCPEYGDLLIFRKSPKNSVGHVAVITEVNVESDFVKIAEQNYDNIWEDHTSYSRLLVLFTEKINKTTNKYFIIEDDFRLSGSQVIEYSKNKEKVKNYVERNKYKILGWKQIQN